MLYILMFIIGLLVGWNLFPQPAISKRFYDWIVLKIKGWVGG